MNYPFANRLYPELARTRSSTCAACGPTVILSDGDVVFQPLKVESVGSASRRSSGRVLIYIHKEQELDDVERRHPRDHYVLVDDKVRILTAVKRAMGRAR